VRQEDEIADLHAVGLIGEHSSVGPRPIIVSIE
jgi:hypothetical protein